MIPGSARLAAWSLAVVAYGASAGFEWLFYTVPTPVGALLLLTFMPLGTINKAIRARLPDPEGNDG